MDMELNWPLPPKFCAPDWGPSPFVPAPALASSHLREKTSPFLLVAPPIGAIVLPAETPAFPLAAA